MKRISIVLLAVVGVACGGDTAAFRPTENVTRSAPGGRPAASYEIRMGEGMAPHARVNVWSRGAWEEDGRTLARVAIEVLNVGEEPIRLDTNALRLDAYRNDGARLSPAQLVSSTSPGASLYVAPNDTGVIRLVWAMTTNVAPDDIGSMRLRWAVLHEDGQRYSQFTDFRRVREYANTTVAFYDPIWGYYDPFLVGPHYHRVPIGRVIIHRDRPPRTVRRDR